MSDLQQPWPRYARAAPCYQNKVEVARVPLRVGLMRAQDATFWQQRVHPYILASQEPRADARWDWRVLRRVLPLSQWVKRRRCLTLTTYVRNDAGEALPAAMHLLIEGYPHLPDPKQLTAHFLWFVAAAPKEAFAPLGLTGPAPALGRLGIDSALVASMLGDSQGRIGLHCAVAGGPRLSDFYAKHCKLVNLGPDTARVGFRRNDGRYFYSEPELAESLLRELDAFR